MKALLQRAPAGDQEDVGPLLAVEGLAIHFGGVRALRDVSFHARRKEVTGVIGPNGAGKTTLFNCVSGLLTPDHGRVTFAGRSLRGTPMMRARRGLGRTFQTPRLFRSLSVVDNLAVGCEVADAAKLPYEFDPSLGSADHVERAARIARLVGYRGSLGAPAGSLPFGDLRTVELARALCAAPKMLMLDEPASGLDIDQALALVEVVRNLAALGLAILLIEHDMSVVMGVCHDITVLDFGTVLATGTPEEVQNNPDVLDAYLGKARRA
ncbi:MAG: branched-chain amino acid transport system ATP-binding protein livF [Actinomycetota bacterium]|jgi:branched-chain amino acid transport system ATP-binding protein|nr:branched-chain amino acid transport system ATP-binding protein livF [Actinomycetota bacterium]